MPTELPSRRSSSGSRSRRTCRTCTTSTSPPAPRPGHPPETARPSEVRAWVDVAARPTRRALAGGARRRSVLGFAAAARRLAEPAVRRTPTGRPAASAPRCWTWSRRCARRASGCGCYQANDPGARRSTGATAWSSSRAPTAAATTTASPTCRWRGSGDDPLAYLRGRIDEVDDELAVLLARRAALTAAVQDHKEVGGHAGRDPEREAEIVERMARHVPGLGRGPDRRASCTP